MLELLLNFEANSEASSCEMLNAKRSLSLQSCGTKSATITSPELLASAAWKTFSQDSLKSSEASSVAKDLDTLCNTSSTREGSSLRIAKPSNVFLPDFKKSAFRRRCCPSTVVDMKFMTVMNCANSMNSSFMMTPFPCVSNKAVKRLHFSKSIVSGWASLNVWMTLMSSVGSKHPSLLTSKDSKFSMQDVWNSALVTCCTNHSGRNGSTVHNRSLSASIIAKKSLKAFSCKCANSIVRRPSSESKKLAIMTNWTT
mmetsp:Transcript_38207/g.110234  ORF Transcript_38207/g.110234 Transcript_38207/m.110234 type:complete len:255 (+) Transcript_38207:1724-2488(+)